MHWLGKTCIGFIFFAAFGAIVLTAKMVQIRNSWTQQVSELKTQNESNAEKLLETQKRHAEVVADLNRVNVTAGLYWPGVESGPAGDPTTLNVSPMGTNDGFIQSQNQDVGMPVVYGYQPTADGTYRFVGPFQATEIRENDATLVAAWTPRPGETDRWRPDPNNPNLSYWRWRTLSSAAYAADFGDLQKSLTISDEVLDSEERGLELQRKLVDSADEHLEFRMQELQGNPANPQNKGLLATFETEDEMRNDFLEQVDTLRRELTAELARRARLMNENEQLVDSLPKPKPPPDRRAARQR